MKSDVLAAGWVTSNCLANWQRQSKHCWSLKPPWSPGGRAGACVEAVWAFRESFSEPTALPLGCPPRGGLARGRCARLTWQPVGQEEEACGGQPGPWGRVVSHTHTESRYGLGGSLHARSDSLFPAPAPLRVCSTLCSVEESRACPPGKGCSEPRWKDWPCPSHRPGVSRAADPPPKQRALIAQELASLRIKSKFLPNAGPALHSSWELALPSGNFNFKVHIPSLPATHTPFPRYPRLLPKVWPQGICTGCDRCPKCWSQVFTPLSPPQGSPP